VSVVVVDASAIVAVLVDAGEVGVAATAMIDGHDLAAPHLLPFEVTSVLRKHALAGLITNDVAALARRDLADLTFEPWPFQLLSERAWELRTNLSIYDASYVALAEILHAPLITLDRRIGRAPGIACDVMTP
jgi:predicted nucleic acid-binding protein